MDNVGLKNLIKSDLERMTPYSKLNLIKYLLFNASFKITFWFRIGGYIKKQRLLKLLYPFIFLIHRKNQFKTGIQLPIETNIGKGLTFVHYSSTVINFAAMIGDNCTIFNGVTIGSVRGKGVPTIGNNVVIATGAKVLGDIIIGNNVMIGANAVVVNDIPDNAVVGGIPAKILNMKGLEHTQFYAIN
ncbi:serine acetyltransferase [Aquimarina addita]|uniref:Serine acetyltransferase n=1 Tax=Aquimarina addita TaxID=870485 RepID=A0ABP6UI52_9FLAO